MSFNVGGFGDLYAVIVSNVRPLQRAPKNRPAGFQQHLAVVATKNHVALWVYFLG